MTEADVHFLVITPTTGRPTLKGTCLSAISQFEPGDTQVVVTDGPVSTIRTLVTSLGVRLIEGPKTQCWGNAQRNAVLGLVESGMFSPIEQPKPTHLIFLDDDDILLPRTLEYLRPRLARKPDALVLCRFMTTYGIPLWDTQEVKQGNVGTGCIVCPATGRLGRYGDRYEGDFDFIVSTCGLRSQLPDWSPLFLQMTRPNFDDPASSEVFDQMVTLNERIVP